MPELAGFNTVIKISGAATSMVGENTTSSAGGSYQITDVTKRVLGFSEAIQVQKQYDTLTTEAGTNTTNIRITGHNLVDGDLIINTTHAGVRLVTKVDNDNVTVLAITGQTTGDTIEAYHTEPTTAYTLDRLNGKVKYPESAPRLIKISGKYLPMTTAAYANQASISIGCDVKDVPVFGADHKKRIPTLKFASGSLTQFNISDTTYSDALVAGVPIVIEHRPISTDEPNRFWAILQSDEVQSAIDGVQTEVVTCISTDSLLRLSI